ncbi:MAG: nuclear transport factor 2 family protein [Candidatus Binatia bacterium]
MKNFLIAALVACTALVAVESFAAPKAEDGIKQTFAQLDRCVANDDAACMGELMADDATLVLPEGGQMIRGRSQIVTSIKNLIGSAPGGGGGKASNTVESVRMIGEDHALVDSVVSGPGGKKGVTYYVVALVTRKGDRWVFQDIRQYVVDTRPASERERPPTQAPAPVMPTPPGPTVGAPGPAPTSPASVPQMPPAKS